MTTTPNEPTPDEPTPDEPTPEPAPDNGGEVTGPETTEIPPHGVAIGVEVQESGSESEDAS